MFGAIPQMKLNGKSAKVLLMVMNGDQKLFLYPRKLEERRAPQYILSKPPWAGGSRNQLRFLVCKHDLLSFV